MPCRCWPSPTTSGLQTIASSAAQCPRSRRLLLRRRPTAGSHRWSCGYPLVTHAKLSGKAVINDIDIGHVAADRDARSGGRSSGIQNRHALHVAIEKQDVHLPPMTQKVEGG